MEIVKFIITLVVVVCEFAYFFWVIRKEIRETLKEEFEVNKFSVNINLDKEEARKHVENLLGLDTKTNKEEQKGE